MTAISNLLASALDGSLLFQSFLGATVILAVAAIATTLLRSQSAALRHRIWTLAAVAVLALPVCMLLLPGMGPQWLSDPQVIRNERATPGDYEHFIASPDQASPDQASTITEVADGDVHVVELPDTYYLAAPARVIPFDTEAGWRGSSEASSQFSHPPAAGAPTDATQTGSQRNAIAKAALSIWFIGFMIGLITLTRNGSSWQVRGPLGRCCRGVDRQRKETAGLRCGHGQS